MNILITSGGTSESIDRVRKITNSSTGRLGKVIAEKLLLDGHRVTLITTQLAITPDNHPNLTIKLIENTQELETMLACEVPKHDAMIHSMAVSDYAPQVMLSLEEFLFAINEGRALSSLSNQDKKVSSNAVQQVILLNQTPKLIGEIKKWHPEIILIGFKLLVGVSEQVLIDTAKASLKKNHADYIFANDLELINENQHFGFLIGDNSIETANTKQEIAEIISNKLAK